MSLNIWLTLAVTGGAVVGYGCYLLIVAFVPSSPALGPALARLHPSMVPDPVPASGTVSLSAWLPALRMPAADLNILGRTPQSHLISVAVSAGVALIVPVLAGVGIVVTQFSVPVVIPVALTLFAALGCGLLAHFDMRSKAKLARAEFVRALCTYAALTAHQVRSGHGAVEAMERAARICDGWPYTRMRTALLTAQLQMRTPWEELKTLAAEIEVVELSSFADIMQSAGSDGAQVYQTLRAQAASLRDQLRVRALETAKTRTSKLDVPATLMIIILLVLVGYPLMVGLFTQK